MISAADSAALGDSRYTTTADALDNVSDDNEEDADEDDDND